MLVCVCSFVSDKVTNLDKMRESNPQSHTNRSNSMDFGFEKIMDFAMDIVNLNLAKMVGKVMDNGQNHEVPDFFAKV